MPETTITIKIRHGKRRKTEVEAHYWPSDKPIHFCDGFTVKKQFLAEIIGGAVEAALENGNMQVLASEEEFKDKMAGGSQ